MNFRKLFIGAGALALIFGAIICMVNGNDDPQEVTEELVLAAQAEILTDIAPDATNTPPPAPTPTSQYSADELLYSATMLPYVTNLEISFSIFSIQNEIISLDPNYIFDTDWRETTSWALDDLLVNSIAITQVENIPPLFSEFHSLISKAAEDTSLMVISYSLGIDELNIESLEQAVIYANSVVVSMDAATAELQAIGLIP